MAPAPRNRNLFDIFLLKTEGVQLGIGPQITAPTAEHDDMYAAIDLLTDKLDRQLKKHKEKTQSLLQGATGR